MKYRKEDLPKLIILSLVLVAAVIWAVLANVKALKRFSSAAAQQAAEQKRAATEAETSQRAPRTLLAALAPVPPPTRDPFEPIIAPRWQREHRASSPEPRSARPPLPPTLPPLPGMADSEALHLSGIIYGPPSIAVIRQGEEAHILKQGDALPGGLRVETITRTSVTLRGRQGTFVLRLGG